MTIQGKLSDEDKSYIGMVITMMHKLGYPDKEIHNVYEGFYIQNAPFRSRTIFSFPK